MGHLNNLVQVGQLVIPRVMIHEHDMTRKSPFSLYLFHPLFIRTLHKKMQLESTYVST